MGDDVDMVHPRDELIGRRDELDQLADLLEPRSGRSAMARRHLLLAGDAGVGKTRLLTEFASAAAPKGWSVVLGRCLDFGDSALPYLPFTEIVDRLLVTHRELVEEVARHHPALARLSASGRAESGPVDRGQLFVGVHALLDAVGEVGPTLVVLEDVHWADQSTRDLITLLLTRAFRSDVVLVVSYRADDLHRQHPLRRQVAEWTRLGRVERLTLGPLDDDEVRSLVRQWGPDVPPRERDDIVARAEGNPFFVEELVSAASGPDHWLPEQLADVLLVRLDRLDDESRSVVRAASVGGRRVRHHHLAEVLDLEAGCLDEALRQAVESHVLVAGKGDYWFRHALLASAVYDDLLPGERVRLHRRYAQMLGTAADGTAAELARHARLAHDLDTALVASIAAGAEAMAIGAPEEAAQHYERALPLMSGRTLPEGLRPALVVEACVQALTEAGRPERGGALAEEQLALLAPDTSPGDQARVLSAAARAIGLLDNARFDPLEISDRAVALAPVDEPAVRASVLVNHALILGWLGGRRPDEGEEAGVEALGLAERHGLEAIASAASTALVSLRRGSDPGELRPALRAAIERATKAGAFEAELQGWFLLARSHQDRGEWSEAEAAFRAGIDRAVAVGRPWAPYAVEPRFQLAWVYYVQGRWEEALDLVSLARPGAPPVGFASLDAIRQMIRQGRGEEVQRRLHRELWATDGVVAVYTASTEMVAAGRAGEPADAVVIYDEAVEAISRVWSPTFAGRLRLATVTIGVLADAIGDQRGAGREATLAEVERLYAEAGGVAERFACRADWGPEGRAWAARLEGEWLRCRWRAGVEVEPEELISAWREAIGAFDAMTHVPEATAARVVLATLLRATGDLAAARETVAVALPAARRLGATPWIKALTGSGDVPADRAPVSELTRREHEIVRLVAEGLSNGEIAARLFISTKTVSVHVSNILAKLGAGGRTEAAAIARRRGLLGD
jgi:DNA-binding CsgD family transcriptional regulator/tetratricopeptide (TPR) repeat protein